MLRILRIALLAGPAGILIALVLLGATSAAPGDTVADRVFGQPDFTSGGCNQDTFSAPSASTLCRPHGVAVDSASDLYVADLAYHGDYRLLKYNNPVATDTLADGAFSQDGSFNYDFCGGSATILCSPLG